MTRGCGKNTPSKPVPTALVPIKTLSASGAADRDYTITHLPGIYSGAALWNVGNNGAAFSLPNNSTASLLDLLKRVNANAVKGKLYDGTQTLIKQANVVFSQINVAGDIGA